MTTYDLLRYYLQSLYGQRKIEFYNTDLTHCRVGEGIEINRPERNADWEISWCYDSSGSQPECAREYAAKLNLAADICLELNQIIWST